MENALAKKLKIKEGQQVLVMNAPSAFMNTLMPLPEKTTVSSGTEGRVAYFDVVLLFVQNQEELRHFGDDAIQSLKKDGILWFAYPKKSSGIKSDLTRDEGWSFLDTYMLAGVSNIAIDDTWSGLRFKYSENGMSHQEQMTAYKNRDQSATNRVIETPHDLQAALDKNPVAAQVFEKFAYTHRKEYVRWIESAKKQETRDNRIVKAIEMLEKGTKIS